MRIVQALAALALLTGTAEAQDWKLVPERSAVSLTVRQGGTTFEARFERLTADIRFDPAALDRAAVEVRVDVPSFKSGDAARDGQATSAAWLAAGQQPVATYRTRAFRPAAAGGYEVDAELSLRGVTRRLTHPVTIVLDAGRARAEGSATIVRTEFGVGAEADPRGGTVGLDVEVRFVVEAVKA
jgi:polyisoprenoid-binding protein YceI